MSTEWIHCLEITAKLLLIATIKDYSLKLGSHAVGDWWPGCLELIGKDIPRHSQSYRSGDQSVKMESTLKSGAPPS